MTTTTTYDFPNHIKGDTFESIQFTVTINLSPLNLIDATIRMDLRNGKELIQRFDLDGGLTIKDAENGVFAFDKQVIDVEIGDHSYDIEFTLSDESVKTYIKGNWKITQDKTHD